MTRSAFLAGGWLAQWYGWRATFLILGIPGILIALAALFVMREPAKGASDGLRPTVTVTPPTLFESLRYLRGVPSFWHILIGKSLWGLFTLGLVWIPHYLQRAFHLNLRPIGTVMAVIPLG